MKHKSDYRKFLKLCLEAKSVDALDAFFDFFLTMEEKNLLASRYLIISELLQNKLTQREISQTFGVSIAQITRGSNALKKISPRIKKFFKQHIQGNTS